jgi:hypothetical protein
VARPSAPKSKKGQRFHQATPKEKRVKVEAPRLSLTQSRMGTLLTAEVLTKLACRWNAADERQRKLTCVSFFWLAVLACGSGGPITLQKMLAYALVVHLVAGVVTARLSKEAVSENFRERPWQFFAAVLSYLLVTYARQWSQFAGCPQLAGVQHLHVLLVDATVMRVAQRLIDVFPASRNGKVEAWAALKLHATFRLFRGVPEVLALSPQKKNERKISFLRPRGEAVLYIFDLGYWTYELFDTIMERQQHFISRLRADCNPRILKVYRGSATWVGKRLKEIRLTGGKVDLLVNLSSANPHNPPMRHNLRLVGQWNAPKQRWHLYVTSLVEWQTCSLTLIVDLYRLRWQIEILFRNLKHVLHIANFVSTTENGVRVQIYATLIHYVLTHLVMLQAAQETGRPLEDFSVPYCLEAVQQVLAQTGELIRKGETPDWPALERRLVQAVLTQGLRPNRKRKPLIQKVKARLRFTPPLPA